MKQGKVWLIGAGPGDAGLLTVKAAEVLQKADVIVYDALVSLEILCKLPPETRKIHVGKRAGHHTASQEEINELLLKEAQEGHLVARLKGGDPFVFGRGGEELELLEQAGIPYEVVPGITSAISAPAYAGIPVTHRNFTSSFHVITGHARKGGEDRIDYQALAKLKATLVFLMGVGQLENICSRLKEAGMDPETPAAIIENGTTSRQRQLLADLKTLPEKAVQAQYQAPSIILVGQVAQLMKQFEWQSRLPLFGKICIVTRPKEKAESLSQRLREQGAHVIELPAITLTPLPEQQSRFDQMLKELIGNFFEEKWLVLSSPSDVEIFFQMLAQSPYDLRSLGSRVRFAVVGSRTREALRSRGIRADYMPETYYSDSLAVGLQKTVAPSSKVYVLKGDRGSDAVYERMTACGIPCEELVMYHTEAGMDAAFAQPLLEQLALPQTYALFTSGSCVDGFVKAMPIALQNEESALAQVKALCIGKKTAEKARAAGMQVILSKEPSINSMIEALASL